MAAYGSFLKISLKMGTSKIPVFLNVSITFDKNGRNETSLAIFSLNLADKVYVDNE